MESPGKFGSGSKIYSQQSYDKTKSPSSKSKPTITSALQRSNRQNSNQGDGGQASKSQARVRSNRASGDIAHIQTAQLLPTNGDTQEYMLDSATREQQNPNLVAEYRSISPSIFNTNLFQNQQSNNNEMTALNLPQSGRQSPNQQIIVTIQSKKNAGESPFRRRSPYSVKRFRKPQKKIIPIIDARKQALQSLKVVQPLPYEDPKKLAESSKWVIANHSKYVSEIADRYQTYTSPKTIPTAMQSKWKSVLNSFKRNFNKESQLVEAAKLRAKMNYQTEDETRLKSDQNSFSPTKSKGYQTQESQPRRREQHSSIDFNLRDAIEQHALSVTAKQNQVDGTSSIRFGEVELARRKRARYLEKKGREIAAKLDLSPQTCCTKLFRVLTPEQPLRLHNQPLSHMVRPMQKMVAEKIQNRKRQQSEQERNMSLDMKHKTAHLSMKSLSRQFKSQVDDDGGTRHQTREERIAMADRIDKLIKQFNARKFNQVVSENDKDNNSTENDRNNPHRFEYDKDFMSKNSKRKPVRAQRSKDDFALQRREWELMLDKGRSFSHLSKQYPIKKKWKPFLASLRQKEADRVAKEKKQDDIVQNLLDRGITDNKVIQRELDLLDFQEIQTRKQDEKKRMGIKEDPLEKSLKLEKLTLDLEGDDDGPGGFTLDDFAGIETGFEKESLEQRKVRVNRARERLKAKREKALELKKKVDEQKTYAEDTAGKDLKGVYDFSKEAGQRLSQVQTANKSSLKVSGQQAEGQQVGFFQQVSQQKQADGPQIGVLSEKLKFRPDSRARLSAAMSQPHPNTIKENVTNESSMGASHRLGQDMKITVAVSSRDLHNELNQQSHDSRTVAQEFGLAEEGTGIFQTAAQNSSRDGGIGETRMSYHASDHIKRSSGERSLENDEYNQNALIDIQSHMVFDEQTIDVVDLQKKPLINMQDQIMRQTDQSNLDETREIQPSQLSIADIYNKDAQDIREIQQEASQKIRPSTTENVQRNARKKIRQRRQIMSGHFNNLDQQTGNDMVQLQERNISGINKSGVNQSIEISSGIQTQQLNQQKKMMERSGPILQGRPGQPVHFRESSNENTQSNFMSLGRQTMIMERSGTAGTTLNQYTDKLTRAQTATNMEAYKSDDMPKSDVEVQPPKVFRKVWKEVLKMKVKEGYEGSEKVPRSKVVMIKREIKAEKEAHKRKERRKMKLKQQLMIKEGSEKPSSALQGDVKSMPTMIGSGGEDVSGTNMSNYRQDTTNPTQPGQIGNTLNTETYQQMPDPQPIAEYILKDLHSSNNSLGQTKQIPGLENAEHVQQMAHSRFPAIDKKGQLPTGKYFETDTKLKGDGSQEPMMRLSKPQMRPMMANAPNQVVDHSNIEQNFGVNQTVIEGTQSASLNKSMEQIGRLNQTMQQWNYMTRQPENIDQAIKNQKEQFITFSQDGSLDPVNKTDYVEFNRAMVKSANARTRHSSHLGRLRQLKQRRERDSVYQSKLLTNASRAELMYNQRNLLGIRKLQPKAMSLKRIRTAASTRMHYSTTSQLNKPYRNKLDDQKSMKIFQTNDLYVSNDNENQFSRQDTWNKTFNCPYYGLHAIRQKQEEMINMPYRDDNLLRPFTLGNKAQRQKIQTLKKAVNQKNRSQLMDKQIYDIIGQCQSVNDSEWKKIYDDNEDFRNKQAVLHAKEQLNKND